MYNRGVAKTELPFSQALSQVPLCARSPPGRVVWCAASRGRWPSLFKAFGEKKVFPLHSAAVGSRAIALLLAVVECRRLTQDLNYYFALFSRLSIYELDLQAPRARTYFINIIELRNCDDE